MPIIKVFIADDAPEIRSYFQMIMKNEPDMEVVGTASSGKEAVEKVMKLCPDIVLMDIQMENRMAGIEAIEQIREINPNIKSIVLTIHEKDDFLFKRMRRVRRIILSRQDRWWISSIPSAMSWQTD